MTQNEIKWFLRGMLIGMLTFLAAYSLVDFLDAVRPVDPEVSSAICAEPVKIPREIAQVDWHTPTIETEVDEDPSPDVDEAIKLAVSKASEAYPNVSKGLIYGVIYNESRFQPNVSNGSCVGLMQVSTYWHANRAEKLGVTDFYDISGNVLIGTDYLSELIDIYKSEYLALMVYHGEANAVFWYNQGVRSWYADSVISYANSL